MRARVSGVLALGVLLSACGGDSPSTPSTRSRGEMIAGTIVPASGGSVTAIGEAPGFFVLRGSGGIEVPLTITPGRDLPYAELQVFLESNPDVTCGANLPDRQIWTQLKAADRLSLSITGRS